MGHVRIYDDLEEQETFKKNVKAVLKDLGMTYQQFSTKIGFKPDLFRAKMSHGKKNRLNLKEALWIADELGEYLEDLCKEDFIKE